jgi:hypothetical protein
MMRTFLFAVCVISGAIIGVLPNAYSQALRGNSHLPQGVCGTPEFSNPETISRAILNTKTLFPETYKLMRARAKESVLSVQQDTLGMVEQFFVYNFVSNSYYTVSAVLEAKGTLTEIWVDQTEINNGHVDNSVVASIENALENQTPQGSKNPNEGIVKLEENYFGMPPNSGVSNGSVSFLITDIKDGWDPSKGKTSYIAGFFLSNDQPDPTTHQYNLGSNKRDMLYIDSYPGIYYGGTRDPSAPLPTLAHEFQHLIQWHYDPNEVTFLNEGCSTNAEVVCGYPMRSPSLYFQNTNVSLFTWRASTDPAVLADYSRATIFMRYLFEQFGDTFAKDLVQNPAEGISGINSTLSEIGSGLQFNQVFQNWVVANALDDTTIGLQYGYSYPISVRPAPSQTFFDPNICLAQDTTASMAVNYLDFPSGDSLIVSYKSAGLSVSAIESGTQSKVHSLPSSSTFYEPQFGSTYNDVTLSLLNLNSSANGVISLSGNANVRFIQNEMSYDDGSPDTLKGIEFLSLPDNSVGSGWAVQFPTSSPVNQLVDAKIYAIFNSEISSSTVPSPAPKQFTFHVWGNNNGVPGQDLITPFLVNVNRTSFENSFVDIDLSQYSSQLTNLQGPVYIGFTEVDTSSTSVGLSHNTKTNHTFAYFSSTNSWTTMTNLTVGSSSLAGWNLMMRAVFNYPTIKSPPPKLTFGIVQNPASSSQISVVCIGDSALRPGSLCGTFSQSGKTTQLDFAQSSSTEFVATNAALSGGGTSSVSIKAAKQFGSTYADTSLSINSILVTSNLPTSLASPDARFHVTLPPSPQFYLATIYKGTTDTVSTDARYVYSIGPKGTTLFQAAEIRLDSASFDTSEFVPAINEDSRWYSLPFSFKNGSLVTSTIYLSTFAVVSRSVIDTTGPETSFTLYQNFPNPFYRNTTIMFDLPAKGLVHLQIYDVLGRKVADIPLGTYDKGERQWANFDAAAYHLASGVYFYQITAGGYSAVKKMMLIK